tara:strand:- start:3193 stop:3411 length:219 start_codon:yes stop_codon:yes gene_type:complete
MIETRKILVPGGYFIGPSTLDDYNYEQLRKKWAEACLRVSELLVIYSDAQEERDILNEQLKEYKKYMRNKNE